MASKRLKKKILKRQEMILDHRAKAQTPAAQTAQTDANHPEIQDMRKENDEMGKELAEKKTTAAKKTMVYIQFQGKEIEEQEIIGMIKKTWKDQGNMMKDLKELSVYIKTEEAKAYYVINGEISGSIDL
ncbi:MAG: DUF6465 family protein [Lachnospiraceae bacterium]|nr:DUF6465 family protein [Robinsoniella sp.]MDY3766831.1 DUF6465 family protein [Lachnospiraceae bacterium]